MWLQWALCSRGLTSALDFPPTLRSERICVPSDLLSVWTRSEAESRWYVWEHRSASVSRAASLALSFQRGGVFVVPVSQQLEVAEACVSASYAPVGIVGVEQTRFLCFNKALRFWLWPKAGLAPFPAAQSRTQLEAYEICFLPGAGALSCPYAHFRGDTGSSLPWGAASGAGCGSGGARGNGKQGCFPAEGPQAALPAPGLRPPGPGSSGAPGRERMQEVWQFGVLLEELLLLQR